MRAEIAALEVRKLSRRRVKAGVGKIAAAFADYDLLTYSSAISFQVLYVVVPLGLLALAGLGLVGEQSLYTDHIAPTLRHDLSHDAFVIADRALRQRYSPWVIFRMGPNLHFDEGTAVI